VKPSAAVGSGATIAMGDAVWVSPQSPAEAIIADSCVASAIVSANAVIACRLLSRQEGAYIRP
jgi:hypothetical protein